MPENIASAKKTPGAFKQMRAHAQLPLIGLIALAGIVLLYNSNPAAYTLLMKILVKVPAAHPFVDLESVSSSIRCWADGVNVYLNNTCYKVWPDQVFNYSPLWLRMHFLAGADAWRNLIGVSLIALFAASLALLPPPRNLRERLIMALMILSCATCLGLERANFDLLMFLAVLTGLSLRRFPLPVRLVGYGFILAAGLLKFYPLVALVVVLRERFSVLATVFTASVAALVALIVAYHTELGWMLHGLPEPSFYTLQFGARDLPEGLGATAARMLQGRGLVNAAQASEAAARICQIMLASLIVTSAAAAIVIARRLRLTAVLSSLPPLSLDCLGAGASLMTACFFEGQSVVYRGIFLLLALPGCFALARKLPAGAARNVMKSIAILAVFVLWNPFIETMLFVAGLTVQIPYKGSAPEWLPSSPAGYLLWLTTELSWWIIVTALLAIAGAFVVRAEAWADASAHLAAVLRRPAAMPSPAFESRSAHQHAGPERL